MEDLMLIPVSERFADAIGEYRAGFSTDGKPVTADPDRIPGLDRLEEFGDIREWIRFTERMAGKIHWFLSIRRADGRLIGCVCLRRRLEYDDDDPEFASHIGYSVRKDERGRGYGKAQLALCLERAKALGLDRVRVICLDANAASAATILACGGIYIDTLHGEESGLNVNRYDIPLI